MDFRLIELYPLRSVPYNLQMLINQCLFGKMFSVARGNAYLF